MNLIDLISQSSQYTNIVNNLDSSQEEYQSALEELDKLSDELVKFSKKDISQSIDKIPHFFLSKLLNSDCLTAAARKKVLKLIHPAKRENVESQFEECPVCLEWRMVIITDCKHCLCKKCFERIKFMNTFKCPMCRTINILK